jgi:hypothetical protein
MVLDAAKLDVIVEHLLPKWSPLYKTADIRRILSDEQTMQGIETVANLHQMTEEEAWDLAMRLDFSSRI